MKKTKKPRTKRKKVGDISAESGQFVDAESAVKHPKTTVAVTKEVEPFEQRVADELMDAYERETKGDEEC